MGHNADVADYEYNPEKSKQLLAKAGYPNGIELEVEDNYQYPTYSKVITAIQKQARAADITIKINRIDNAVWADIKKMAR